MPRDAFVLKIQRIMSPEVRPKSFGTFEKQAPVPVPLPKSRKTIKTFFLSLLTEYPSCEKMVANFGEETGGLQRREPRELSSVHFG